MAIGRPFDGANSPGLYADAVAERVSKAAQSERTRGQLIRAARTLFAAHGFEAVAAEEIASSAGVTTGALYHQFKNKRDLFRAAFEAVEAELTTSLAAAASSASDLWAGLEAAVDGFLDSALSLEVRQIVLIDALSVIGWREWDKTMNVYGLGLTRQALSGLMEAGYIRPLPVDALAYVVLGALSQGAIAIATADDGEAARRDMGIALKSLLDGLRQDSR